MFVDASPVHCQNVVEPAPTSRGCVTPPAPRLPTRPDPLEHESEAIPPCSRLQNLSTTGVDSRGLTETGEDAAESRKPSGIELLIRKDERHRLVADCRAREFDSRQLHSK
jgi:hypothetical protein